MLKFRAVYVKRMKRGSPAEACHQLSIGDQIVAINGKSTEGKGM